MLNWLSFLENGDSVVDKSYEPAGVGFVVFTAF